MAEGPLLPPEHDSSLHQVAGKNHKPGPSKGDGQDDCLNRCPLSTDAPQLIPWLPKAGMDIVEASLVWILWIVGSDIQASGHKCIGYSLNCLAVLMFFLLSAQVAFGKWQKLQLTWGVFGAFSLIPIAVYTWLIVGVLSEPKPHFTLALNISKSIDSKLDTLEFTNNAFALKKKTLTEFDVRGFLMVPLDSNSMSATLRFVVENNSGIAAPTMDAAFEIANKLTFSVDPLWQMAQSFDGNRRTISFEKNTPTLDRNGNMMPGITFEHIADKAHGIILAHLRGVGATPSDLAFQIAFTTFPIAKPYLTVANVVTNGGTPMFDFSTSLIEHATINTR